MYTSLSLFLSLSLYIYIYIHIYIVRASHGEAAALRIDADLQCQRLVHAYG